MLQTDKELIKLLRKLAKVGWGTGTGLMLEAAADRLAMLAQGMNDEAKADRIIQLEREKHDILHLWYKGKEMCVICAHRCTNTDVDYCSDCNKECLCLACEGECWEEAQNE